MGRLEGSLRSLIYSIYERRLAGKLVGKPVPQHVGVMCDGNRRWAREMGFVDPNDGTSTMQRGYRGQTAIAA